MAEPQPAPESEPPERLLARYLDGDGEAFAALVGMYEERLFTFLARMTGDSHLAEDVFQIAFVKVAANAAAYDGRASFSTWLFRIARNAAVDEMRKRRRGHLLSDPEKGGMDTVADPGATDPLEKLTRDELGESIRLAIATLPEAQREAFLLKEEAELDFGEIGEILGCGRETAKSRFRLAVGKLRIILGMDDGGCGKAERT